MNSSLRRLSPFGSLQRPSLFKYRPINRAFSSESKEGSTKEPESPANPARTFMWLAGMGGFMGAFIYFVGQPDREEDKNVRIA